MHRTPEVALSPATAEAEIVERLFQLYAHDLSDVFGLEIGDDARFANPELRLFWSEPTRRFPFLIRADGRLAGFVLATLGSPVDDDPATFDVTEFFVMKNCRRAGVGGAAALLLWSRLPGRWTVRVSEGNRPALAFWERTIAAHAGGFAERQARPGRVHPWRVFTFVSGSGAA